MSILTGMTMQKNSGVSPRVWVLGSMLSAPVLALLAACDPQRISELEEGVATEADMRARFGEPAAVYTDEIGSRTFEYPRQPAGQVNYMSRSRSGTGALRKATRPVCSR